MWCTEGVRIGHLPSTLCLFLILLCLASTTLAGVRHSSKIPLKNPPVNDGQTLDPLPKPADIRYSDRNTVVRLSRDFLVRSTHESVVNCDLFHDALKRFHQAASYQVRTQVPMKTAVDLKSFQINLKNRCVDTADNKTWPSEKMNESYQLSVSTSGNISLTANEVWGVLRGLETVLQLIFMNEFGERYMPCVTIVDAPRFLHRGFLIDTSRHFLPLETIKEHLDAMGMAKLNVLHWHIVDDQAFPYQSRAFPNMSFLGAYNPITHVYSQVDVADIIEYSRRRGIRVIPEFDTPGHTLSWGAGITSLLTPCYSSGKPDGSHGPVDPTRDSTYTFMQTFMSEQANVFPDNYLHLGGDEVDFTCWRSNPQVTAFMKKMGIEGDYDKLEQYYMNMLIYVIQSSPAIKKDMKLLVWQEVVDNQVQLPKDTLVHVWKGGWENETAKVTKLGFTTLLSSCWYLNYINYGPDWESFYKCDPHNFPGTDQQKKLVLGGEACMWGEYVDGRNMIQYSWPRTLAVAERLWSPKNVTDTRDFSQRYDQHRCRMIRRGIRAQPPNGPNSCDW